ncbi:hypothetical protein, partial [Faecalibacterium sp. An77]|uniref:hypothetical protein n=1 Tax=Faecalibacterium sp. An77 TaxID=1965655 RepID=UPI0019527D85
MQTLQFTGKNKRDIVLFWHCEKITATKTATWAKMANKKSRLASVNCTPFVRQYGILKTNGVFYCAKREAKQEIYTGIQENGN